MAPSQRGRSACTARRRCALARRRPRSARLPSFGQRRFARANCRLALRELRSGVALGALLGVLGFLRILLWARLRFANYGDHPQILALAVGVALVGIVLWGSLSGAMLPFLLRLVKLDPATSSAPASPPASSGCCS